MTSVIQYTHVAIYCVERDSFAFEGADYNVFVGLADLFRRCRSCATCSWFTFFMWSMTFRRCRSCRSCATCLSTTCRHVWQFCSRSLFCRDFLLCICTLWPRWLGPDLSKFSEMVKNFLTRAHADLLRSTSCSMFFEREFNFGLPLVSFDLYLLTRDFGSWASFNLDPDPDPCSRFFPWDHRRRSSPIEHCLRPKDRKLYSISSWHRPLPVGKSFYILAIRCRPSSIIVIFSFNVSIQRTKHRSYIWFHISIAKKKI